MNPAAAQGEDVLMAPENFAITVPIASIIENTENPRTITEAKFEKLVQSILDFPEMLVYRQLVCITVIENGPEQLVKYMPLGGNMRRLALIEVKKRLEQEEEIVAAAGGVLEYKKFNLLSMIRHRVPIMLADQWSQEQRDEFIIKDNLSYGAWDWDKVSAKWELPKLKEWGMDIPDFKIKANIETIEDDFDTTPPNIPKTVRGDLYELNGHRLSCGDSQSQFTISALMAGTRANLCMTSPPYWVGKDYEKEKSEDAIESFIREVASNISMAVDPDCGRIVINTGTASINRIDRKRKVEILLLLDKWAAAFKQDGWLMRHLRIWLKRGQLPATISPRTDVIDQHNEYIACFEKEYSQVATFWNPDGEQRGMERLGTPWAQQGVWDDIHGEKSARGRHNAAYPVTIPARNILLYTKPKEIVFEPFSGAGTTIIAAEQTYRYCFANEISEGYCDVSVRRWVSIMKALNRPFVVKRNGDDITSQGWLHDEN